MADETITFFNLEDPYGCLSNASRHAIYLDGIHWKSVEHYFQTAKFEKPDIKNSVYRADTPGQARRLGRKHRRHQRSDWHDAKVGVMREALVAKTRQHADVRASLLVTTPARLVQSAEAGSYWGGEKNMLGKLWMQVRDQFGELGEFDALTQPLAPPWEKYPDIDFGSIGWRMGHGEAYMHEWAAYFHGLSPAGRRRYRQMFPAPDSWSGFYEA